MITVTIDYQGNDIRAFTVIGHAGFAPKGTDIYCAGVSAAAQSALLGLINQLSKPPQYSVDNGVLTCELEPDLPEKDKNTAQIILTAMEDGLLAMQQTYGRYLQVIIRR